MRLSPLDASFSYISSEAESDAFFSDSQFVGVGFRSQLVAADELRLAEVYPGSPAAEAGLERDRRLLEINGRAVADLQVAATLDSAFGPAARARRAPARRGARRRRSDVKLAKATVTIPTVALTRTFDVDGRRVGYVLFRNFVQPSTAAPSTPPSRSSRATAPTSWSWTCATTAAGSSRWPSTWPASSAARARAASCSCSSSTTTRTRAGTRPALPDVPTALRRRGWW